MSGYVYLDYAASAPVRPEALEAERAYDEGPFAGANPNSLHTPGREAARALDGARRALATIAGGGFRPQDVIFTSGGTENNNVALHGLALGARGRQRTRTRVLVSAIEHDSGLDVAPALRDLGFTVELLTPSRNGVIEPETLKKALGPDVALVSVMCANNETGVVQPIGELGRLAHSSGAVLYADCAQGFAKMPLDLKDVDAIGVVGHKIGAPVGVGAILARSRVPFRPLAFGGGQERGIRPGTQDVRGALALAAAAKASSSDMDEKMRVVYGRMGHLVEKVCAPSTGIIRTVAADAPIKRLPGIVSVMVPGVDSESLVLQLDARGFCVSAASACASGSLDASHVLLAMGISRDEALGSLRVSFDERVEETELDAFADALIEVVSALKARR